MGWAWNAWGLTNAGCGLATLTLAALVWRAAGSRTRERWLAILLFLLATSALARGSAESMSDPRDALGWWSVHWALWPPACFVALAFLGTLPSPLAAPIASSRARAILGAASVASVVVWVVVLRDKTILGMSAAVSYSPWHPRIAPGVGFIIVTAFLTLFVHILGLAVALDLVRRTPRGSQQRRQAKAYAVAFGVTDLFGIVLVAVLSWLWHGGDWSTYGAVVMKPVAADPTEAVARAMMACGWATNALLLSILLAYAILKAQLFDIDLRIKWTIRKGTVAAAFVGAFFVVSEAAKALLSDQLGPVAGLLAAGGLVFALAPLQRAADRLADKAMPRVIDDAEYRTVRKREVYRAAIESALEEGDISPKERGLLATFAEELGLGPKEMNEIEREARRARAGVA